MTTIIEEITTHRSIVTHSILVEPRVAELDELLELIGEEVHCYHCYTPVFVTTYICASLAAVEYLDAIGGYIVA